VTRAFVQNLASLAAFFGLWQIAASLLQTKVLPPPFDVALVLYAEISNGQLIYHLQATLIRLALSFFIAMFLGIVLGITLGRRENLNRLLDNWLIIFLNIPALVSIILCYVWFGLTEFAAITAVVANKLPNVIVTIREGARTLDRNLIEMSRVFRFGAWKTIRHLYIPEMLPFIIAASRTGLALIWKIILVVELLGRSDGMGYKLHLFFQLFNVSGILAYTFAFIAVIQLIELCILRQLDRRATRWRR
jgi:NitT/TauT family transport system permease protein